MNKKLTPEQNDKLMGDFRRYDFSHNDLLAIEHILNENTEEELDKPCPKNCKHYHIGGCDLGWVVYCNKPELKPLHPCPECEGTGEMFGGFACDQCGKVE